MKNRAVKVFAPATISNLGSGFDVLGIAIHRPGDYVTVRRMEERGLQFSVQTDRDDVPVDATRNVAAHVAALMLDEFRPPFGVRMVLDKRMPVGSGLGSSAASSVASVVAVNALLPKPLPKKNLLRFAVEGERKAAGAPHADNAAPSLLGGLCLVRSYSPLDVVQIPIRNSIVWVVVHPHIVVKTEAARRVLPKSIPLKTAVHQWGNVGGLIAGMIAGNASLVGKCVEDIIAEPVRSRLVKGFHDVKEAALASGALGCTLSGSGPSLFAVTPSMRAARVVAASMSKAFWRSVRVKSDAYISRVNMDGAKIVWIK